MTGFAIAVQQVIYAKLLGDLTIPVYDDVPQSLDSGDAAAFPYVTIGEDVITYADTDTDQTVNVSITIHVWSRSAGRKETKVIQGQIHDSLHNAELLLNGFNFVIITEQSSSTELDPDGHTRHGVQTFNLILEKLS